MATLDKFYEEGDEGVMLASMAFGPYLTALETAEGTDAADAVMPGAHLDAAKATRPLRRLVVKLEAEQV